MSCEDCVNHEKERDTGFDYCSCKDFEEDWIKDDEPCDHFLSEEDVKFERAERRADR